MDSDSELLRKMKSDWDARARENARYYVATSCEEWSEEDFLRSGERHVREVILSDMQNICQEKPPDHMRILEIGCGAGRVTRMLGRCFGEVDAVDISSEMIARAQELMNGCPTVRVHQNNGKDLSTFCDESFDFVFSSIVFQHIPSKDIVENYIREVARVLRPDALFKFQVQGAPISEEMADTWVGVGFTEHEMRGLAEKYGFEMRYQNGSGTQDYWLWFFKKS